MTWHKEPARHDLARRRIKTKQPYNKVEVKTGIRIEAEHVDTIKQIVRDAKAGHLKPLKYYQQQIAQDHLDEITDYYTRLVEMEKNAKNVKM